jgi:hypothetical protein
LEVSKVEHRDDLEQLLLAGLPDAEREHVEDAMTQATEAKLRRTRDLHPRSPRTYRRKPRPEDDIET